VGIERSARRKRPAGAIAALLAVAALAAFAVPAHGALHAVQLGTFSNPLYPVQAPGEAGRIFVVEQSGRIKLVDRSATLSRPFLDIRDIVLSPGEAGNSAERGLLSMAFPPDYATSHRFYVYFTNNDGDIEIDQFRRSASDPTVADPASRRQVIVIPHPTYQNHNGGTMQFGPGGHLYFATGDGGGVRFIHGRNARNLNSLLGKLIRIDPLPHDGQPYGIPATNPYVGKPGRDEIFAYGLRNPFRFTFDGGRIAIGDVGQYSWEEVDILPLGEARGANFGWPYWEGDHVYGGPQGADPPTFPIFEYPHDPACAVIGGLIVRNPDLPSLDGRYLYGDRCLPELRSFIPHVGAQQATDDSSTGIATPSLTGINAGLKDQIYFTAGSGLYRLVETP